MYLFMTGLVLCSTVESQNIPNSTLDKLTVHGETQNTTCSSKVNSDASKDYSFGSWQESAVTTDHIQPLA